MRYEIRTRLASNKMLENTMSYKSKVAALRAFDWLERQLFYDGETVALYRLKGKSSCDFVAATICEEMGIRYLNSDPFNL